VMLAKRYIIDDNFQEAHKIVFELMRKKINDKVFVEGSMELLPPHFILAEANIGMGGAKLKKAETFLVAAYWNLLKFTSDKDEKGGASDETLVDAKEIE